MTKKFSSQISKSEYIEIKSARKEADWAITQHFTFLRNGIMET